MFDRLECIFSNRDGGERSLRVGTGHDTNPVFEAIQAHLFGVVSDEEVDGEAGDASNEYVLARLPSTVHKADLSQIRLRDAIPKPIND